MGDDTPAIQAVLDADVWRKVLLREQDVRDNTRNGHLQNLSSDFIFIGTHGQTGDTGSPASSLG